MPTIPEKFVYDVIYDNVTLNDYCMIGANCTLLPGVTLEEGISCAAGLTIRNKPFKSWTLIVSCTDRKYITINRQEVDTFKKNAQRLLNQEQ